MFNVLFDLFQNNNIKVTYCANIVLAKLFDEHASCLSFTPHNSNGPICSPCGLGFDHMYIMLTFSPNLPNLRKRNATLSKMLH